METEPSNEPVRRFACIEPDAVEIDWEVVGPTIARWRKLQGYDSARNLAIAANVSSTSISKLEAGQPVGPKVQMAVEKVLGFPNAFEAITVKSRSDDPDALAQLIGGVRALEASETAPSSDPTAELLSLARSQQALLESVAQSLSAIQSSLESLSE